MPSILFGIIFLFAPELVTLSPSGMRYIFGAIVVTTFVIPSVSVLVLRTTSTISSLSLFDRKERIVPFIFILIFYLITTYMFGIRLQVGQLFFVVMASVTFLIVVLGMVTVYWKISIHSAAASGLVACLLALYLRFDAQGLLWPIFTTIFCAGAVMSARLYLNAHRPAEVEVGLLVGAVIGFSGIYFFL